MGELPDETDLEARYGGAASLLDVACFLTLFLLLLLVAVLLSNQVAHHWHWRYLPEAAGEK